MAKRRANGEGTLSLNNKGYWVGQITLGTDPKTCKQIRRTVSAKTQKECREKLDELKRQIKTNTYVKVIKQKYNDYLRVWLEQKLKLEKLKASTIVTYSMHIKNHIKSSLGLMEIQKIRVTDINELYTGLADKMNAKTVHRIHAIVNNSLKFAVRDGIISMNPAENALLPKVVNTEKKSLSEEQVNKLLNAAKEYQKQPNTKTKNVFPLIALGIATGMRRGELAALEWTDIDLENEIINISRAVIEINGVCMVDTPKTQSSIRKIHISKGMVNILKEHKEKHAPGKVVFPARSDSDKPMSPRNINRFFDAVVKKAGLDCSLHILRHSHITHLLENNVNVKTIKDRAGHASLSTTMGYAHPSKQMDINAAECFDKFFFRPVDQGKEQLNPNTASSSRIKEK